MKNDHASYVRAHKARGPTKETINLGGDGPYFRDGHMNRDSHSAPAPAAVVQPETHITKTVHVMHHRDRDD